MDLISFINKKLAIETVVAHVFILLVVIYLLFFKKKYPAVKIFFANYYLLLSFIVALVATTTSLFYSQYVGFDPCSLCWFQRIFMYPLVILFGVALMKKDSNVVRYALPMSVIGFLISLYHNYLYYYNQGLNANCQILGNGVSCVKRYVFEFGYVTIPIMSLTAFALIIIFMVFYKLQNVNKNNV